MATGWGKPGASGGGFAAALGQKQAAQDALTQKFVAKYGKTPLDYVNTARNADRSVQSIAIEKMGVSGEDFNKRSGNGRYWTQNSVPSDSPSKDVIAYHNAEDSAKALAALGKLDAAVSKVDEAISLREKYQQRFANPDAGHTGAISLLRARRNSMSNLVGGAKTSEKETEAIALVRTFYTAEGASPPAL